MNNNMILTNELFIKYKEYLVILDYPYIKQQTDIEIRKIFDQDCREFLLSWLISKLIPAYKIKLEEAKNHNRTEQVLANIIYENGFCRLSEKESFVKGNLDIDTQVNIFDRIFSIQLLYSNNIIKENMSANDNSLKQVFMKPTDEGFRNNVIIDINLSEPTIGLSNKITTNEKTTKINYFKSEIDKLKNILENKLNTEESQLLENEEIQFDINNDEIKKLISKFTDVSSHFNSDGIINVTGVETPVNKLDLEKCVSTNSQDITNLLQVSQKKYDLNILMRNKEIFNLDTSFSIEDDYFGCVLQNYVMSDNILQEIQRNNDD